MRVRSPLPVRIETSRCGELVHIDVRDGVFCPQITVGPPIVKALRTPLLKDVHLMIDDPLSKVDSFVQAGGAVTKYSVK